MPSIVSRRLAAPILMLAVVTVGTSAAAQSAGTVKERWMTACAASGGGSSAYCDCTFEAIGSRMSVADMSTMIAIVEAAMTGDPAVFGAMADREGLDREAIAAWDQRMQSLSALAERECSAFAPGN